MEFRGLILSSLILLAFFAANAQAVLDAGEASESLGPGQSLADTLLDGSKSDGTYKNDLGFAATPKAQREIDKNKSSLDWSMPSTLTGGGASAKDSRTQAESSSEEAGASTVTEETAPAENTSAGVDTELPPVQPEIANAGGNWYFTLNDSVVRDLALVIFQNGNDVFGAGKIKEENNTLDVTVSGTIADASLELDVVSMNPISCYKLKLDLSGDFATGKYQAFSTSGDSWTGSAEGEKTA
jgi:hypothetical protein